MAAGRKSEPPSRSCLHVGAACSAVGQEQLGVGLARVDVIDLLDQMRHVLKGFLFLHRGLRVFEGNFRMNQPKAEDSKTAKASESLTPAANAQAKTIAAKPSQTPAAQAPPPNAGVVKAAVTSNASDMSG